jgi:hypothetical protein
MTAEQQAGTRQFSIFLAQHFFLFGAPGAAWTIDLGRFITYTVLIATVTWLAALIDGWCTRP